jgi:hypothetical protein
MYYLFSWILNWIIEIQENPYFAPWIQKMYLILLFCYRKKIQLLFTCKSSQIISIYSRILEPTQIGCRIKRACTCKRSEPTQQPLLNYWDISNPHSTSREKVEYDISSFGKLHDNGVVWKPHFSTSAYSNKNFFPIKRNQQGTYRMGFCHGKFLSHAGFPPLATTNFCFENSWGKEEKMRRKLSFLSEWK